MHKKIGIIGGMSPESTIEYYSHIVHTYSKRFGNQAYPEIIIYSVSFEPYIHWPGEGRWDLIAKGLSEAAQSLEAAGAEVILIATNTMHLVFDQVQAAVDVPMINLLSAVGEAVYAKGLQTVGLLGTSYTMEALLYPEALAKMGIKVITPDFEDRKYINRVIYKELVQGEIQAKSRQGYLKIIRKLAERGAQGVILGCTEIPLLINEKDTDLPLFDTTILHAAAALEFSLS